MRGRAAAALTTPRLGWRLHPDAVGRGCHGVPAERAGPPPPPRHAARPAGTSRRRGGPRLRSRPAPRHLQDRGPLLPWPPPKPRSRHHHCAGRRGAAELLGRRLGARRRRAATFRERHGGIVGIDGVENALVADLRLGDEADLAAQIRGAGRAAHGGRRPGRARRGGPAPSPARSAAARSPGRPLPRTSAPPLPRRLLPRLGACGPRASRRGS